MSKHTPGPWTYGGSIYRDMAFDIAGEKGVAQVWKGPNAAMDAHLIAAAPDLLTALIVAEGALREEAEMRESSGDTDYVAEITDVVDQCAAAIAKATQP